MIFKISGLMKWNSKFKPKLFFELVNHNSIKKSDIIVRNLLFARKIKRIRKILYNFFFIFATLPKVQFWSLPIQTYYGILKL